MTHPNAPVDALEEIHHLRVNFINTAIGLSRLQRLDQTFMRKYFSIFDAEIKEFKQNGKQASITEADLFSYVLNEVKKLISGYNESVGFDREVFRQMLTLIPSIKRRIIYDVQRNVDVTF